jgi:ribonuclease E
MPATGVKNGVGSTGTHAITEDVKNALAQIAKSTVPNSGDHAPHHATHHESADSGAHSSEDVAVAAAEAAVEILEIPVQKTARGGRRVSPKDAENILGSVLEALPEPKEPGQGRRGSRRASTAGNVVTPPAGE